jgi:HSP20 family protein
MNTPLTTTLRRDPFGSMFDDFFSDMWTRPTWMTMPRLAETPSVVRARMDVVDKGPSYVITVDMPGVKKEDINVSIEGSRIAITAETVYENPVKEGEKLLHTERFAASYARSFELPTEVTETGAEAVFENGVLTLTLPKRAPVASKRLMIH